MFNSTADLPVHIRKAMPEPAQQIFMDAYNAAEGGDPCQSVAASSAAWKALHDGFAFDGAVWTPLETEKPNPAGRLGARVAKVDSSLGVVFGWAMVCKIDGEPYFDLHGSYIPEDVMLKSAERFMSSGATAGDMHSRDDDGNPVKIGKVVFAWPLTDDIAETMQIKHSFRGLMIGMKPDTDEILKKFAEGVYTGFSVGGHARWRDIE